ncbi:class I SAM-dependent DNA methyltransferase [Nocardia sp. NPDC052278]|uniref:class I SAM-dependent DNA methyltransferase n=1 Tax=unclassified Nocardia TaxID=2637762 RepID=UPI0036B75FA0
MADSDELTVTAADVARMAAVGRAAVSNWRKRHDDFPKPVGGTAANPSFSLVNVERWLTRQGKLAGISGEERLWQQLKAARGDLYVAQLLALIGEVFLHIEPGSSVSPVASDTNCPTVDFENIVTQPLEESDRSVIQTAVEVASHRGAQQTFRYLRQRFLETRSRRIVTTPQPVIDVVSQLLNGADTVFDPACGIGSLLAAAGPQAQLIGQDADESLARVTSNWLTLENRRANIEAADSILGDAFAGRLFDAVVCHPPFGDRDWGAESLVHDGRWIYGLPPRGEPELAWIQHCLAHAKPGGLIAVCMPSAAASRPTGRKIRAAMLRGGALQAVITGISGSPDLWILRRPIPGERPLSRLLLVDTADDPEIATTAWRAFQRDPEYSTSAARAVRIIDLLDDDVDISPARRLTNAAGGAEYSEVMRELLTPPAWRIPNLLVGPNHERPMVTVAELVRAGAISVLSAPVRMELGRGDAPVLTAKDVRLERPASGLGDAEGNDAVMVRAGDVVVPATGDPVARVCREGGALLGPQIHLIRTDPQLFDADFLAGFLQATADRSAGKGASARIDVRRLAIPRMPIDDQRRYGRTFRELAELETAFRRQQALCNKLIRAGFAGLADGVLQPSDSDV